MDGCSCTVFRNLCCCTRCFRCKNFCLLPAVFSSRSFENDLFTQEKLWQCKFRRWAIFSHGVCCKNCKNFCLLPAVFSSRSFDYVVFTQAKLWQCKFRRWTVLPTAFFCAVTTIRLFCNCLPSSWCLFRTVFFYKNSCILFVSSCLSVFRF